MKTQNEMLDEIKHYISAEEARKLILEAYNAEIVSNRLGRLEDAEISKIVAIAKRDLLRASIARVHEVVCAVGS
jgi:transcriptional regulator CtsR